MVQFTQFPGRPISRWAVILLLAASALAAAPAQAVDCSEFPGGIIDGATGTPAPDQVQIDRTCTIRNYPASNPLGTNFSFLTQPGQTDERWLIIFDNVVHTGQMACNAVAGHKIWFTNGSSTSIQEGCQNLLIPVEKIDKQNPAGQTTASIGVPFTYRLTMPVLFDSATGVVINTDGSLNDLHGITLTDDLNATGADLRYVSHQAYYEDTGAAVPHTFSNAGGLLTFDNFPVVPAGRQIIIELTVVLNDSPANVIGNQFVNTAKWDFGRLIDGVFYEPLPGEWGISEPLIIAGPELMLTKSGPATLNLAQPADFTLDVQNVGNSPAWNASIIDRLPDGPRGGFCDVAPELVSAQVFAADGVTAVPGKGPLVAGVDFNWTFQTGVDCELALELVSGSAAIGAGERLIVTYRTQLDNDSDNAVALTNVAGATGWFNDAPDNPERQSYTRNVTNGTPGTLDHQDAHTVTTALSGVFFEKTVVNLTSGQSPAVTAAPGDRMRYTLRLRTTDTALVNVRLFDDLGAMNGRVVFQPGSLTLVAGTLPPGSNATNTNPSGGTNGAGIVDIRNVSLLANREIAVQFDVTLASSLADGTPVTNQADLLANGVKVADSDDPNVNGVANPDVVGDEDPTRFMIEVAPAGALGKAITQPTAAPGETFSYRLTVPAVPHTAPIYDVRILDDLAASAADLEFVAIRRISGPGSWTPVNSGAGTGLVIEAPGGGIDIPAGQQAVIELDVRLADTATNVAGLTFTNTASYTYNQLNGDPTTQRTGAPGTSAPMTVVEPLLTLQKSGPLQLREAVPAAFALDVHNTGGAPAYDWTLVDVLPSVASGGMCDTAPAQFSAQRYGANGTTPVGPALRAGTDFDVGFAAAPTCTVTVSARNAAAVIGPGERLIVSYEAYLDGGSQQDTPLTNVAGATEWFSAATASSADPRRRYSRTLSNGTVGVLDHEDAHTGIVFAGQLLFEKTAVNLSSGQDPASVARPGDRLRYRLRIENVGDVPVRNFGVADELDRLNAVPAFQPGTLTVLSIPPGSTSSGTDPSGGQSGTGELQVAGLDLDLGESALIEFEVVLAPVLANASYVVNQSQITLGGYPVAASDDPNVNGQADPVTVGDEDPTRVRIQSAPAFDVDKVSRYLDGDPAVLLAGERLRYSITVRNVGDDNAVDARLRDELPANTAYVTGSTTLNGAAVADAAGGAYPLSGGIAVSAAGSAPGYLPALPSGSGGTGVATLTFDVVVDGDVADGTVVSNQAYVSAPAGGVSDQPSDDPRTATENDPTRDVVGNFPLVFAEKSAALIVDGDSPGIVDPGDYLRYTILVHNNGSVPATMVRLQDVVPTDTTYVADSLTLNGTPVGQPDDGTFPLALGVWISSADLTPPLPGPGAGTLSPGQTATIQFDVRVDDGVARGTLITNQATVTTEELGSQLTDGDGNPATGPEPTVVVVGDAQALAISKQVSVVGGGAALAGALLEYVVTVQNIGAVPAVGVYVTDDLDAPVPGQLLYVDQSAALNGQSMGVSVAGPVITANYSAQYGALEPGQSFVLRFQAQIHPELAIGTTVTNVAQVTWNTDQTATASVAFDVGGTPGSGVIGGLLWHDADFDDLADEDERLLAGWIVELRRNDRLIHSTAADAAGAYHIAGLVPNYQTQDRYDLTFRAPDAGPDSALLGVADSDFTNGLQHITDIVVLSGSNLQDLNLPIEPNGVVYDSLTRAPLRGVTLSLRSESTGALLPDSCFDDAAQQGQVSRADGHYRFDLNFSDPSCPSGAGYVIEVVEPGAAFAAGYSEIIPPARAAADPPFDVPLCPGGMDDVVPTTVDRCEIQLSEFAPGSAVPAQGPGTAYHVRLLLSDAATPGSSQVFNNHIPLDPVLDGVVTITKTTPMVDVTRGQMVPYTITVNNAWPIDLPNVDVVDRYPVGFKYIEGSARLDGQPVEPVLRDRELVWENLTLAAEGQHTIELLLAPGAGVAEGKYTNRAQAMQTFTGNALSGEAGATVRLVPDPTFDCTDVTGKVFDDANRNGLQEDGEEGLVGVRLVTPRGLAATTDPHGRFHITCAITPREGRGSNFMLKLDDRTLPSGYRASTEGVQIKRATRGKALHFSFGASIHRVIGLDIADPVFEPDSTDMRPQWRPRIGLLLEELQKGPSVLRLSYLADVEDPRLVERRIESITEMIEDAWRDLDCCYRLSVEHEVFWRMEGPPSRDPRFSAKRETER